MARALAEAFVRVRADTSGVRRDIEKDFDGAGQAGGQRFGESFTRDANGRLHDARGRFVRELEDAGDEAGDKSGRSFAGKFASAFRRVGGLAFRGFGAGLSQIAKGARPAALAILGVGAAATALNTAVHGGVALAPLAGFLAGIPGAAIAAGVAIGTLKLAMSGLQDAFGAALSGDAKKLKAALEQLPPAARSVVKEVSQLRPVLLSIRATAQQNLFAPLKGELTALTRTLAGPLKQGIADVAIQFGTAGRQVAEFARQSKSVELVRAAFGNVSFSLGSLRQAIVPILTGLRGFALEGLSFLPQVAAVVGQIGVRFGQWLQQMVNSGRATEWIRNALATFRQIGTVVVNVGGIIKSVFSAASAAGSGAIGVLGQALGALNRFLKTAAGQQALTSIFTAVAAIGQALSPIIAALATQLGGLAGPLGRLAAQLGPVLLTAINALGPALQTLEPGIAALIGGLGRAFQAIANSGALTTLGQAISDIAVAIAPVLPIVGQLAAILVKNLATSIIQIMTVLTPVISVIANSLAPILPQIALAFTQLAVAMAPIASRFGAQLAQALVQILPPLLQIVPQLLTGLVPAMINLLNALTPLMPQLIQLGVVLATNLAQTLPPLLPPLIRLVELLVDLVSASVPVVGWILQISTALAQWFGPGLATGIKLVAGFVDAIVRFFRWLFDTLIGHSIIPDIVNGAINWFGALPGRVIGFFRDLANGAVSKMRGLLSSVNDLASRIIGVFGDAGSWLYRAGQSIINGLLSGLWSKVQSLWNAMARITQGLRDFWPFSPAKVGPLSGGGSPHIAGANIGGMLAEGMERSRTGVARTAARLAAAASPAGPQIGLAGALGAAGGASGGGMSFTAADIGNAVASAIQGVGVHMDGEQVGQLVSRRLGRATEQRRRTG